MAIENVWTRVEEELTQRERYGALLDSVTAMRRLVSRIRTDERFTDTQPSVSHGALLFRRPSKRLVLVDWNNGRYELSFVKPPFEMSETKDIDEQGAADLLFLYLNHSE